MKMTYNWLVAGMLAVTTATPVLDMQARPSAHVQVCMTITDAVAYRILELARGPLEAQMNVSFTLDYLFHQFKQGGIVINHIATVDGVSTYQVSHTDGGGSVLVDLDDF